MNPAELINAKTRRGESPVRTCFQKEWRTWRISSWREWWLMRSPMIHSKEGSKQLLEQTLLHYIHLKCVHSIFKTGNTSRLLNPPVIGGCCSLSLPYCSSCQSCLNSSLCSPSSSPLCSPSTPWFPPVGSNLAHTLSASLVSSTSPNDQPMCSSWCVSLSYAFRTGSIPFLFASSCHAIPSAVSDCLVDRVCVADRLNRVIDTLVFLHVVHIVLHQGGIYGRAQHTIGVESSFRGGVWWVVVG